MKSAVIIFHKNIHRYPERWINECIRSIKEQTYQEFDVFEIDYGNENRQIYEGSNFESRTLLNHAEAHNELLDKVFDSGYDCAFNVNVDDYYTPDRFEKQLPFIELGYDVISSNFCLIDENGKIIGQQKFNKMNPATEWKNENNIIAHPVLCYSKHFWTTCTKLDGKQIPRDDFELWKRSYGKYRFIILPDFLLFYRVSKLKISKK